VFSKDSEEVLRGGDAAAFLREVVLEEGEEGVVANARSEFVKEVRAAKVNRVGVGLKSAAIVDGDVYVGGLVVIIHAVCPPPIEQRGVGGFVVDVFAVGGKGFVKPREEGLVVGYLFEPPLMGGFVRGDEGEVVFVRAVVEVVEVAREEVEGGVFHAVVEVALYRAEGRMGVRAVCFAVNAERLKGCFENGARGSLVGEKIIRGDGDAVFGFGEDAEFGAEGENEGASAFEVVVSAFGCRRAARCDNGRGGFVCEAEGEVVVGGFVDEVFAVIPRGMENPFAVLAGDDEGIPVCQVDLAGGVPEDARAREGGVYGVNFWEGEVIAKFEGERVVRFEGRGEKEVESMPVEGVGSYLRAVDLN